MNQEFDRQIQNLIEKNYPKILHLSIEEFKATIEPLRAFLPKTGTLRIEQGKIPFVIVIKSPQAESEKLMELVTWNGQKGFSKMYPHETKEFLSIDVVKIPDGFAYLLLDIDRGKEMLNVAPDEALQIILGQKRLPLTIDEGIALITQFPDFLFKNNCFSLLASRCPGNKRVPAIWINAAKKPNLGWCWDGNPHTWLGSASCSKRYGM